MAVDTIVTIDAALVAVETVDVDPEAAPVAVDGIVDDHHHHIDDDHHHRTQVDDHDHANE